MEPPLLALDNEDQLCDSSKIFWNSCQVQLTPFQSDAETEYKSYLDSQTIFFRYVIQNALKKWINWIENVKIFCLESLQSAFLSNLAGLVYEV